MFILSLVLSLAAAGPASAEAALAAEHPQTRQLIDLVTRAGELFAHDGHAACEAFKQAGSEWLHGEAYVFVLDLAGTAQCHPAQPALEGRNLFDLHDADGRPIMELMVRQLEGGAAEGWVHYLWPRPGGSLQTWKSTYLRRVRCPEHDADYIVASGAYNLPLEKLFVVERVDEAARLLAEKGREAFATLTDKASGFVFLDSYVFVMSFDGVMLAHPVSPDLEGRDVLDVKDPEGIYPGREMLKLLASTESGWVEYFWPRPDETEPTFKETYVRKVETGGEVLVVGAGVYLD